MSEFRQIASLVIISILIVIGMFALTGVIPALIEGDLVVTQYNANLYQNGTFTEHYDYLVKNTGEYRMLFRFWNDPLVTSPVDIPSIQFVSLIIPRNDRVREGLYWYCYHCRKEG